ncbi:MAG: hypothetical protein KIT50_15960 [Bacteroidetes bacterium]|nr:hypothetical protein [Bacteroidota bacterium]
MRPLSFSILAGVGFPVSNYKSGAEIGFGGRAELNYQITPMFGWASTATVMFNNPKNIPPGYDVSTYSTVFVLTGLRLGETASNGSRPYLLAQAGLLFGSTPSVSATFNGITATQSSASGTAFGYGIAGGLIVNDRFHLCVSYLKGTPEVTITASGGGYSYSAKGELPFSIIFAGLGVSF